MLRLEKWCPVGDLETKAKIIRLLSRMTDIHLMREIRVHLDKRVKLISDRKAKERHDRKWAEVLTWPVGTPIWCCAQGTFIGGDHQRGDEFKVYAIQPRAKRLWVTKLKGKGSGTQYWFSSEAVCWFSLETKPPAAPIDAADRKMAEQVGKMVEETFDGATSSVKEAPRG